MSKRFIYIACMLGGTLLAFDLPAGSVFMKNGYIIQGPIVERNDGTVTLGWPNGKVTIRRRFIDVVQYEQEEEARLIEDEAHRARDIAKTDEGLDMLEGAFLGEPEDLPPDLDMLMNSLVTHEGENPLDLDPTRDIGSPLTISNLTDDQNGIDGITTVTPLPSPESRLGERVTAAGLSLSLKPPAEWTASESGAAFKVVGPPGADGFSPSINLVSLPMGALTEEEYIAIMKEENAEALEGFELVSEGPRDVGLLQAYELVGQGVRNQRQATVRQVLVAKGDTLWLISSFTSSQDADDFAALDECLKSVEFAPTQGND